MSDDHKFDLFSPERLARRTDHENSKAAAREIQGDLKGLRARALALVEAHPGKTARQLSALAGDAELRTVGRRLGELNKLKLVKRGESVRCGTTNRMVATWWAE